MKHIDYRTLLNQGRKAGLRTTELYQALTTRQPEGHENADRQADCNGFVSGLAEDGRRVYRPVPDK
jgi:hypothetical protein